MQRELLLLREMIDAAVRVTDLIGDLDLTEFRADDVRRDAVLWNLAILGEAAAQIPDSIKGSHPDVGWANPTRLRNRIVHGYWDVDLQIVHDVASDDLPVLIDKLSAVLEE